MGSGTTNQNWLDGKDDEQLLKDCLQAHKDGSFITTKHDPDEFHDGHTEQTFRTVVSDDAKANLEADLEGGGYDVERYYYARHDSQIAVLIPNAISTLTVAGSGILPYHIQANSVQDSLVVAFGHKGPHVFAENKSHFTRAQHSGKQRYTKIVRSQRR